MTLLKQIYKCSICGNIIEVLHPGVGDLVCCGQPMEMMVEKTKNEGMEKHVPLVEKIENGYRVKIGIQPHPMEKDHCIEWIEFLSDGKYCRKLLSPGGIPEAIFDSKEDKVSVRAYCNVHGLWKSE